jgi:parallel beta-helix repeat protein
VETALPTIDGGVGTAVSVGGTGAGTIGSFILEGDFTGVTLNATAIVRGNQFVDGVGSGIGANAGAEGSVIEGNVFNDPASDDDQAITASGGVRIEDNTITGYHGGISVLGGTSTITGNEVTGTHQEGTTSGAAIRAAGDTDQVTANYIHSPGTGTAHGILLQGSNTALRRNVVLDHSTGVGGDDVGGITTLHSDLIAGASNAGLSLHDFPATNDSDVIATNVTLADNGVDISLKENSLTLNSSIVEDPINIDTSADCSISFSRGPTTTGGECERFQTTSAPMFVNPGADNYHLLAASPMIDTGDPSDSGSGARDLDGGPRACDGDGDGVLRRDIGADEFRTPAGDDCKTPNSTIRKPKVNRNKRRARIRFSSTDPGSTFECKLDNRPFRPCGSPKTYRHLKRKRHTFRVRATDAFGNEELAPAVRRFRVRRPPS